MRVELQQYLQKADRFLGFTERQVWNELSSLATGSFPRLIRMRPPTVSNGHYAGYAVQNITAEYAQGRPTLCVSLGTINLENNLIGMIAVPHLFDDGREKIVPDYLFKQTTQGLFIMNHRLEMVQPDIDEENKTLRLALDLPPSDAIDEQIQLANNSSLYLIWKGASVDQGENATNKLLSSIA